MQKSEDCLSSSLFIYQAYLFKESTKSIYFNSLVLCQHSPLQEKKRVYTLKSPETNTPHFEILPLHDELINFEHSQKWLNDKKYCETEKEQRYKDDDDDELLKLEGEMTCSTGMTWAF